MTNQGCIAGRRVVISAVDGLQPSSLNNGVFQEVYFMARALPTIMSILIITLIFVVFGQWQTANKTKEDVERTEKTEKTERTERAERADNVEQAGEVTVLPGAPLIRSEQSASSTESDTDSAPWTEIVEIPAVTPAIRADVPDKRLIKLNRESLLALAAGQEVDLPMPHFNSSVRVLIRAVDKLPSGNISILGKIEGNPLLDFVMTVSEKSTFATIGTEQGVFSLRGDESLAWIAPARAFNHHVDPTVLDYRLPNQPDAKAALNQG